MNRGATHPLGGARGSALGTFVLICTLLLGSYSAHGQHQTAPPGDMELTRQRGGFIGEAPIFGGRYQSLQGDLTLRSVGYILNGWQQPIDLTYAYYNANGGKVSEFFPAEPLRPATGRPASIPVSAQALGNFGLVVRSDGPIVSVTYTRPSDSSISASDAYIDQAGLPFEQEVQPELSLWAHTFIPRLFKHAQGLSSVIGVGDRLGAGTRFRITYRTPGGAALGSREISLPTEGSRLVSLVDEPLLADGFVGSAVIAPLLAPGAQSQAVVTVRTVLSEGGTIASSDAYSVAPRASTTLYAPALFNQHRSQGARLESELCVQSAEGVSQRVTIRYGDGAEQAADMAPFESRCFPQAAVRHAPGWAGGATVRGSGAIAGVVFTAGDPGADPTSPVTTVERWSYTLIPDEEMTRSALLPVQHQADQFDSLVYAFNPHAVSVDLLARFQDGAEQRVVIQPQQLAVLPATHALAGTSAVQLLASRPLALAVSDAVSVADAGSSRSAYQINGFEAVYQLPEFAPAPPPAGPLQAGEPGDAYAGDQSVYRASGVVDMWARGLVGGMARRPVTVAVIDTGVAFAHPDLSPNVDQAGDRDFVDGDAIAEDADGHGTQVAGIVGAQRNNLLGGAGVGGGDAVANTPGLRILGLRVAATSDTTAECVQVADAVRYATGRAHVINLSLTTNPCPALYEAITAAYNAGAVIVAGAGNSGTSAYTYPAAYGEDGQETRNEQLVIAVCGLTSSGLKHPASNYGPWVDVCAPFGPILTTSLDPDTRKPTYETVVGTSASAALVSGVLGVMIANYGWSGRRAVAQLLNSARSAETANTGYRGMLGAGAVDARAATDAPPEDVVSVWLPALQR